MRRNFDDFRNEFDKLPRDEQFRLGVSGLFHMVEEQAPRRNPGGYNSVMSRGFEEDVTLHKDTVRDVATSISGRIQKVKITDVMSDLIDPVEGILRDIQHTSRIHQNRLHHESTLYYQGMINAIGNLGANNRSNFFRALYLNYQSFMRHPVMNSLLALNDYFVKPLMRFGMSTMFGFGKQSDSQKIIEAINKQTDVVSSGGTDKASPLRRLIKQGVVGFAFNEALSGVKNIITGLGFGDDSKTLQQQMLDAAIKTKDLLRTDIAASRDRNMLLSASYQELQYLPDSFLRVTQEANQKLIEQSRNKEDTQESGLGKVHEGVVILGKHYDDMAPLQKSYYEQSLEAQEHARKELEDHNKRERRRSLLRGIGGLLGGGGALVAGGLAALGLLPDTIKDGLWEGFKFVAGGIMNWIGNTFSIDTIMMGLGGTLALIPPFTKIGLILAGVGGLIKVSNWIRDKLGGSSEEDELMREDRLSAGSGMYRAADITAAANNDVRVLSAQMALDHLRNRRASPEMLGASIGVQTALDRQIGLQQQRLREARDEARRDATAALNSTEEQSTNSPTTNSILDLIGDLESRGNYNALVYGNNTAREADLTNMTIAEVQEFQRGMVARGHASSAVGKYQFIQSTLGEMVAQTPGIDRNTQFTPEVQDRLATQLLERRANLGGFLSGDIETSDFMNNVAGIWASVPNTSGRSQYHGIAGNKAGIDVNSALSAFDASRSSTGSSFSHSSGNTSGRFGNAISAITGGAVDMSSGDGFLSGIMSAISGESSSTPSQPAAVIDQKSIDSLGRMLTKVMESLPVSSPSIDISGIGE